MNRVYIREMGLKSRSIPIDSNMSINKALSFAYRPTRIHVMSRREIFSFQDNTDMFCF
jgi:hypothetical protein